MTSPAAPPRDPDDDAAVQNDALEEALERSLFAQDLLPAPPDLAARVVAALPQPAGRVLSLQAIVRLAAAVLLVLGTSVATLGGMPTLAHAEPPALVEEVFAQTREILPEAPVNLTVSAIEEAAEPGDDVPTAALAGLGAVLLGAGLLLARRPIKEKRT